MELKLEVAPKHIILISCEGLVKSSNIVLSILGGRSAAELIVMPSNSRALIPRNLKVVIGSYVVKVKCTQYL